MGSTRATYDLPTGQSFVLARCSSDKPNGSRGPSKLGRIDIIHLADYRATYICPHQVGLAQGITILVPHAQRLSYFAPDDSHTRHLYLTPLDPNFQDFKNANASSTP